MKYKERFAFLGGDDAHTIGQIGNYCTLVPRWVKTEQDLVKAIKEKEVKPYALSALKRKMFDKLMSR